MGISVEQWRAAIGSYNASKSYNLAISSTFQVPLLLIDLFSLLCFVSATSLQLVMKALMLLILLSGDVERNPGPDIMGECDGERASLYSTAKQLQLKTHPPI